MEEKFWTLSWLKVTKTFRGNYITRKNDVYARTWPGFWLWVMSALSGSVAVNFQTGPGRCGALILAPLVAHRRPNDFLESSEVDF